MRVDVAVRERDERDRHVRRAERAVDEAARLEPLRVPGQRRGELRVLPPDEPVGRHAVGEAAGPGLGAHACGTPPTTAEAATASATPSWPAAPVTEQVGAAHVDLPGDEQLLGGEARDHVAAGRRHDDLLLDARRRAAVGRGAVGLEREDHPLLELDRMVERVHARDHRRLVQADADAVAELEPEARLLVGEAELLRGRPDRGDLVRRHAGADEVDRGIEPFAAARVGVELRVRHPADVERAVVARPVAHERVDDVEERLVARAQQPVGEDVRMRVAAVARDGVDRLDSARSPSRRAAGARGRRSRARTRRAGASGRSPRRPRRRAPRTGRGARSRRPS